MTTNYELVKHLYVRLRAAGRLQDVPRVGASGDAQDPPIRVVARVSYDYFLSILEPMTAELGELLTALSWMAVLHNNVDHLPVADTEGTNGA